MKLVSDTERTKIDKAVQLKPMVNLLQKIKNDFVVTVGRVQNVYELLSDQDIGKIFSFSHFRRICREMVNQADQKSIHKFFRIEGVYTGGNILEHFLN